MPTFDFALVAYAPNGNRLGQLPTPTEINVGVPLSDIPSLTVSYPRTGVAPQLLEGDVEIAVETMDPNGNMFEPEGMRFLALDWSSRTDDASGMVQFVCPNYLYNLQKVVTRFPAPRTVTPSGGSKNSKPQTTIVQDASRTLTNATAGSIMKLIIDEAKARGNRLTGLTYDFTAATDSAGQPWAKAVGNYELRGGKNALDELVNLADLGLADFRMVGRKLQLFNPDTAMATDRTTTVALRLGRHVAESPNKGKKSGIAGNMLFVMDGNKNFELNNPASPSPWGVWEDSQSLSGTTDENFGKLVGQQYLKLSSAERIEMTRELLLANDPDFLPFYHYKPGDFVTGPSATGADEKLRVHNLTLTRDNKGTVGGNVVLGDRFLETERRTKRRLSALTGGVKTTGTNGPPTGPILDDYRVPPVPVNVSAGAEVYIDPTGVDLGVVSIYFTVPATDSNGEPTSVDKVELWSRSAKDMTWRPNTMFDADAPQGVVSLPIWADPGVPFKYEFKLRAIGYNGRVSGFSSVFGVTMVPDTTPPAVPFMAQSYLSTELGVITVKLPSPPKGTTSGTNQVGFEPDFEGIYVYQSKDQSTWTRVGEMRGPWLVSYPVAPADKDMQYFCLSSFDRTGNESAKSRSFGLVVKRALSQFDLDFIDNNLKNAGKLLLESGVTLDKKLADNDTAQTALQASQSQLRTDLDAARVRLSQAEKDLDQAEADLATANTKITANTNDLTKAKSDLDAANVKITANTNDLTKAKSDLDAANVKITANTNDLVAANSRITSAQGEIDTLKQSAGKWQSTGTGAPTTGLGSGVPVGGIYTRLDSTGKTIGVWRWDGSKWVKQPLDATFIPQIDIGSGTFGNLDGVRLKAASVAADKVLIGMGSNFIPNAGAETGGIAPHTPGGTATMFEVVSRPEGGKAGKYMFRAQAAGHPGDGSFQTLFIVQQTPEVSFFPVQSDQDYLFSLWYKASGVVQSGDYNVQLLADFFDAEGKYVTPGGTIGSPISTKVSWSWTQLVWEINRSRIPAAAQYVRLAVRGNCSNTYEFDDLFYGPQIPGTLLVNGTITSVNMAADSIGTRELIAGSVTTSQLAANAVTAGKIAADSVGTRELIASSVTTAQLAANAVTAGKIAADSVGTRELIALSVTANQLAANAVVAGKVAANTITAREIAANTITAAQINSQNVAADLAQFIKLDVGNLVAGSASIQTGVIDKLWADFARFKKVMTDMLYVGGQNLIGDPGLRDATQNVARTTYASGTDWAVSADTEGGSLNVARIATQKDSYSNFFPNAPQTQMTPVQPGEEYLFRFEYRARGGTNSGGVAEARAAFNRYDATGKYLSYASSDSFTSITTSGPNWWTIEGKIIVPSDTYNILPAVQARNTRYTSYLEFRNFLLQKKADAALVVDGSIVGQKLAVNAVGAREVNTSALWADSGFIGEARTKVLISNIIKGSMIDGESFVGQTFTGPIIRTSASGARVQLDRQRLTVFDASNQPQVNLGSLTSKTGHGLEVRHPVTGDMLPLADVAFGTQFALQGSTSLVANNTLGTRATFRNYGKAGDFTALTQRAEFVVSVYATFSSQSDGVGVLAELCRVDASGALTPLGQKWVFSMNTPAAKNGAMPGGYDPMSEPSVSTFNIQNVWTIPGNKYAFRLSAYLWRGPATADGTLGLNTVEVTYIPR